MKTIDMMGNSCPIPVIEAKKVLANPDCDGVLVKVDNTVSVQNLERMATGYGFKFSFVEKAAGSFEVTINKDGKKLPETFMLRNDNASSPMTGTENSIAVVIGRNTMGSGAEDLGKILIKGFIYSLSELAVPPKHVIFLNSGAYLTTDGANTVDDLRTLEAKGTEILTCGTCANFYELQDNLAVGKITDMFGITERITAAAKIINI